MARTHTCGELRRSHVGQAVTLSGWVQRRRDHGSVLFIDLRDRQGMTQIVFNSEQVPDVHKQGEKLGSEDVVAVTGLVNLRPDGADNQNLATGDVEVLVQQIEMLNEAKTPPFVIEDEADVTESCAEIPLSGFAPSTDAAFARVSSCRDASHEEFPKPGRVSGN